MAIYDRFALAWAAGFFDGEGSFTLANGSAKATINQVDPEVLYKFQGAVQLGVVSGPYKSPDWRSPQHQWRVGTYSRVQQVLILLWPWLGTIKRAQAVRTLRRAAPTARYELIGSQMTKTVCRNGHLYAETGVTKWGQCREYMRECDRKRSASRRKVG